LSKSQNYYYDNEAIKEDSVGLWTYNQERRLQRVSASGGALSGGTGDSISGGSTRNKRTVWTVTTKPYAEAHFATYPPDLIQPCVLAGCPEGGTVLDPFNGSGTTGQVALQNGRKYIGIELNSEYIELTKRRLSKVTQQPSLFTPQPTQWGPVAMFGDD
jgi:DNA modification methylase